MDSVRISVIVAVYNREDTLDRCIDSLVYQTFQDMEVIFVDDQSEDNSMQIMQRWQKLFSDKIRILSNPNKGVAHAKNLGIQNARGQYIAFVDSDDYVDYKMFERLYACAEQNQYPEIVVSPIWSVSGSKKWKRGEMSKAEDRRDYLKLEAFFLPGKLLQKELFERFGLLPDLGIGEDVSWVYPVISYAKSIVYDGTPGYYYELSPNSISINKTSRRLIDDVFKGSERIIRETNPEYADLAKIYAYKRIVSLAKSRIAFRNVIEQYMLDHFEDIESIENLEECAPTVYKMVATIKEGMTLIPQTGYINGFSNEKDDDYVTECARLFEGEAKIVVLNKDSYGGISQSPAIVKCAYEQNQLDFVAKYFAVKACYEDGGIFIDRDITVDYSFELLLRDRAFFGFESDDSFTDKVFGCQPGNPVFGRILQTYEMPELYEDEFAPLSRRIKTVLIGMGNVRMCSKTIRMQEYGFCVYPVDMFVYSLPYAENLHLCHYKPEAFVHDDSIPVPIQVLKSLSDRRMRLEVDKEKKSTKAVSRERDRYKGLANKRSDYIVKLEQEREIMLHSWSWRISKPVRLLGGTMRAIKKAISHE